MWSGLPKNISPRAQDWGQVLTFAIWFTFGDRVICDRIKNKRSFILFSQGVFPYPNVSHVLVCLTFWP